MAVTVTPMIHVPDVQATIDWYKTIGFELVDTNQDERELNWALMSLGNGRVMFSLGGRQSADPRREVDLYIQTEGVDSLYERLKSHVDVVEDPHVTFYGMREFIVRDVNGFWVSFGQPAEHRPN